MKGNMDRLATSPTITVGSLVARLRATQAERDALAHEVGRLESELVKASIALSTAIQEGRPPIWPPSEDRRAIEAFLEIAPG